MSIALRCPHCQKRLSIPAQYVGKALRCKGCDHKFSAHNATIVEHERSLGDASSVTLQTGTSLPRPRDGGVPQAIGGFAVHRLLGEGAFGQVFLGYDKKLDRWLALKVPHPQSLHSERARHRFEREAKATAQLRHPHIVPLYAAGYDGQHHFLASQFIAASHPNNDKRNPKSLTLDEFIKGQLLSARQAAMIVHDLAEALHYAHTCGIIHRDVKPANVMVDDKEQVHLADFGLAHLDDSVEKLTHEGAILGTPAYMAPELAKGASGDAHPACDQYSLGILMYALLCGDVPFSGPVAAVLSLHVNQEPKPPRVVKPDVPHDLETICLKALAKRPEERYPSCQAMADDLRRWLDGEPIQARRMSMAERCVRWCKKNPLSAGLAGAVFLVLVVGTVVASSFAIVAQSRAEALRDETRRANQLANDANANLERAQVNEREAKANWALAKEKSDLAQRESRRAKRESAVLALQKGLLLCDGQIDALKGIAWLARSLDLATQAEDVTLIRCIRRNLAEWSRLVPTLQRTIPHSDSVRALAPIPFE